MTPRGSPAAQRVAVITATYVAAGLFAGALQSVSSLGGIYWPAAGVAVGGLLISPRRSWPAIVAAILAVQLVYDFSAGYGITTSVLWSLANVTGHVAVSLLIHSWRGERLDRTGATVAFVGAAFLGSVPAGLLGALGSTLGGWESGYAAAAVSWIVGDWLGILTVAPVVLLVGGVVPRPTFGRPEFVALVITAIGVTTTLFTLEDAELAARLSFLALVPLVWGAMRLRIAGAAVGVLLTTVISVTATALGRGPFAVEILPPATQSVLLHLFLAGITVTALLLASRTVESEAFHAVAVNREMLLAAVSHELRTPLTPIVGFSELLLNRTANLDPAIRDGLEIIHRNGRHLTTLIDNLLLLSLDQRDRFSPVPGEVELVALVRRLRFERQDANEVEVVAEDGEVTAWADGSHVERTVANLLDNAAKYGAPPVRVEVASSEGMAQIAVVDHGPGVAAWFVDHLFEVFAQETVGDRRATIGLGLGLPICRDLALANGGSLTYDQTHAGGARFVLRLPLDRPAAPSTAAPSATPSATPDAT